MKARISLILLLLAAILRSHQINQCRKRFSTSNVRPPPETIENQNINAKSTSAKTIITRTISTSLFTIAASDSDSTKILPSISSSTRVASTPLTSVVSISSTTILITTLPSNSSTTKFTPFAGISLTTMLTRNSDTTSASPIASKMATYLASISTPINSISTLPNISSSTHLAIKTLTSVTSISSTITYSSTVFGGGNFTQLYLSSTETSSSTSKSTYCFITIVTMSSYISCGLVEMTLKNVVFRNIQFSQLSVISTIEKSICCKSCFANVLCVSFIYLEKINNYNCIFVKNGTGGTFTFPSNGDCSFSYGSKL